EIGRVTFAFDRMLTNLRLSIEEAEASAGRTAHLQEITAKFSRALQPKEVAEAVVTEGIQVLGASGGFVVSLEEKSGNFEIVYRHGHLDAASMVWKNFSLVGETAKNLKAQAPLFLEKRGQVAVSLEMEAAAQRRVGAAIVIPLGYQDGNFIGALGFLVNE